MRRAELAELVAQRGLAEREGASFTLRFQVGLQLQERRPPRAEEALARALEQSSRAAARFRLLQAPARGLGLAERSS